MFSQPLKIGIGSKNRAKVESVKLSLKSLFPEHFDLYEFIPVNAESGIAPQPMSALETMQGAKNRAQNVMNALPDCDFAIGLEGGIEEIGNEYFESGHIAVLHKSGKLGLGTSARLSISKKIYDEILTGKELGEIVDEIEQGNNIREAAGIMGILTKNLLSRSTCYQHGIIFAFSPFYSSPEYWC